MREKINDGLPTGKAGETNRRDVPVCVSKMDRADRGT